MNFQELKSRVATLSLGTGSNYRVERNTGSTIIMNSFGLYQIAETTVGSVREANDIGIIPEHDRLALQKLAYKYSRTPLDERRDEPKFQVRMMYGDEIMSRKIKFRGVAKNLKNIDVVPHKGIFVYGNLVHDDAIDGSDYIVGNMVEADEEYCTLHFWEPIKKGSAEQFTGLKDINDQEAYEGDIVSLDPDEPPCQIVFAEGKFEIVGNEVIYDLGEEFMDCVIIGNIHENPELVEEEE